MAVYLRAYRPTTGILRNAATPFKFPGGEVHLKDILPEDAGRMVYVADVRGAELDDLMAAALWADVAHDREMPFVLMVPYLPAARADRGEPCGKYVYAKFIETMGADRVYTIDVHSNLGHGWYRRLVDLEPLPLLDRALESQGHWRYDGIIAPDKGAKDRANAVAEKYGLDLYVADKVRDFQTGKILDYKLTVPKSGKYLVVDDICDGGWTFSELAKVSGVLKSNLDLWVTHGIFSGRANELKYFYKHILTSDSHPGHNRVGVATTIVPVYTYMHNEMVKGTF
ncbi:ribose-phosphate pyrophosphokinase [Mycobacterium phage CicholasNage]|uniref:ribose-phosphate diphosphokinase n=1 Tax=Mycobacterium phage CicholasNage TaxID=2500799 RepID=A0A411BPC7_9CAUD|nr:ribose-phosphate pyrophosphokinase [Mycobacterium phage CicholasNage]QAY03490.1 phosphoribosyl pyrophosphate transferase [Mycobacterium phage CicholasNage]